MTGIDETQQDLQSLKQLFAQRVGHQAQLIQELWSALQDSGSWSEQELGDIDAAAHKLRGYAERFEQPAYAELAVAISQCVQALATNHGNSSSPLARELGSLMQRLQATGLREEDHGELGPPIPLRKPIYLALVDFQRSCQLARQLEYFGFTALVLQDESAFHAALQSRRPSALVMDVDFAGARAGLQLVRAALDSGESFPVVFFSEQQADTATRLDAVRAGGLEFYASQLEAAVLLERLDELTSEPAVDPWRVLVIDDSRAQAMFTERTLSAAGMATQVLSEPLQAIQVLDDFQPDVVLLDMYMPDCNGPELARVIRQNERYRSLPIIFLSGEEDPDKQVDAISGGGDDFLNKPVKAQQLVATVQNRAIRSRRLKASTQRDNLTGLYNHGQILQKLEQASHWARVTHRPLCLVMLDIDQFRKVNDLFGHAMGDRVIRTLGLLLKQRLRKDDQIGRYGGEEFAVVLSGTDVLNAARVIDQIRERFAEIHYPAGDEELCCTFSAGIAVLDGDMDARTLASLAATALHQAKDAGRNRVEIYQPRHLNPAGHRS